MTKAKPAPIEYKDSGRPCCECYHSWEFIHLHDITYYCRQRDVVHFHDPAYRYKRGVTVLCSTERQEPRKQGFWARLFCMLLPPSTPCGPQGRLWDPMSARERSRRNSRIDKKRRELREEKNTTDAYQQLDRKVR